MVFPDFNSEFPKIQWGEILRLDLTVWLSIPKDRGRWLVSYQICLARASSVSNSRSFTKETGVSWEE